MWPLSPKDQEGRYQKKMGRRFGPKLYELSSHPSGCLLRKGGGSSRGKRLPYLTSSSRFPGSQDKKGNMMEYKILASKKDLTVERDKHLLKSEV